ncbi:hypothetical protein O1L55_33310 [Streptomyces albulus]|nr:hypothetical protein [Streptomyces noursei]
MVLIAASALTLAAAWLGPRAKDGTRHGCRPVRRIAPHRRGNAS